MKSNRRKFVLILLIPLFVMLYFAIKNTTQALSLKYNPPATYIYIEERTEAIDFFHKRWGYKLYDNGKIERDFHKDWTFYDNSHKYDYWFKGFDEYVFSNINSSDPDTWELISQDTPTQEQMKIFSDYYTNYKSEAAKKLEADRNIFNVLQFKEYTIIDDKYNLCIFYKGKMAQNIELPLHYIKILVYSEEKDV